MNGQIVDGRAGGAQSTSRSAQPCGCDRVAGWICEQHQSDSEAQAIAGGVTIARAIIATTTGGAK